MRGVYKWLTKIPASSLKPVEAEMDKHKNLQREMSVDFVKMEGQGPPINNNLTSHEILKLRMLLKKNEYQVGESNDDDESYYPEFGESTHAWMVFADKPKKRVDRLIGTVIFIFQIFTYYLFAAEAIEDYSRGYVLVKTTHETCVNSNLAPEGNFMCEAETTNTFDAIVAFGMIAIFLASGMQQSFRALIHADTWTALAFAGLAVIEVITAYLSASIAISYQLWVGEVTDAVEAGIGLLFIRELSTRAYDGIRNRNSNIKNKTYVAFCSIVLACVLIGLIVHPICEKMFAP